jgi:hypothetical protein
MILESPSRAIDELLHRGVGSLRIAGAHGFEDRAVQRQAEVEQLGPAPLPTDGRSQARLKGRA